MCDERLPVGAELDAEVARKVFGFWFALNETIPDYGEAWWGPHSGTPGAWVHASCWFSPPLAGHAVRYRDGLPKFSSDLTAAWAMVEHFRAKGWLVIVKDMPPGHPYLSGDEPPLKAFRRSTCEFSWMPLSTAADCRRRIYRHPWAFGDTPAEAICRAALEAVDAEREVTQDEINAAWKIKPLPTEEDTRRTDSSSASGGGESSTTPG